MPKKPYTPSLSRLNICALYHEAKYRNIPMTKLADDLIAKALSGSVGSARAIQYGLPALRGLLILGIPGTGKSLTAKATATVFGVPLLKLDAGRLFAGLVGQSEGNLRSVIQTAEAIAPCCLWIDEVEKGFAGSKSSGATDGGTSARVFGSFISWMQEKKAPVFIVATANDVSQLPPEILRKGRFDELSLWTCPINRRGKRSGQFRSRSISVTPRTSI